MSKDKREIIWCTVVIILMAGVLICKFFVNQYHENMKAKEEYERKKAQEEYGLPCTFTDSLGNEVTVESLDSVVILYGSFAECWINGGGELTGTTEDAIEERNLKIDNSVKIVGTVKEPNLEEIIALNPTLVIMSADIQSQQSLGVSFEQMGIPHAYMRIDVFQDYLDFLKLATTLNDRDDLYYENGIRIEKSIDSILSKVPEDDKKKVLFLRAFSTGAKAKTDDNFACIMLEELGCENIASKHSSLLEELSIEEIIEEDPEYIFVTTMGNEEKALKALEDGIGANPAWNSLSAVNNDKFIVLPKDLFHYKPNARWAESYEYLAKLLYPEVFSEN